MSCSKFGSRLEGHPSRRFPYVETMTGSLGQGLSMDSWLTVYSFAVTKMPKSGKPAKPMDCKVISTQKIAERVRHFVQ